MLVPSKPELPTWVADPAGQRVAARSWSGRYGRPVRCTGPGRTSRRCGRCASGDPATGGAAAALAACLAQGARPPPPTWVRFTIDQGD